MGISVGQFVASLSTNGILPAAQISGIGEKFSADDWQADADALARELVQQRKLTKFQAFNVYQGRGKGLVYGEYVVFDKLGEGGMGQVYKAQHRRMKRIVALKILPPSAVDSPRAVERFHQEVEVAAQLQHPNIVVAYDAGEAHGRHFLVMEYVDGADLSSYVKQHGPLGVEQGANVVLQAARGLAHAHSLNIIHRDVKPSNLLINRQGVVKILDMGLARFDNPLADAGVATKELTTSGEVMGTVDYMAPEQASDTRTADHRADIYALGCTLYRLLTGRPPYTGETMIQKILAHREQPIPSLRAARGDVPEVLDRLYQKMLAKHIAERTPAMSQVVGSLEKLLGGVSDERSSVVLGEEAPRDDNFDWSLLPSPSGGPSGVLAGASKVGGSSIGGSKPGSSNVGIPGGMTMAPATSATVPQTARLVTAQRMEHAATPEPPRGRSPVLIFGGGVATAAIIAAGLFLALRKDNDPPPGDVAAAVPSATPSATPPATPQPSPTPAPVSPSPSPTSLTQIPVVASTTPVTSFFGGTLPTPTAAPTASSTASAASPSPSLPTATATPTPAATSVAAISTPPRVPRLVPTTVAGTERNWRHGVRTNMLRWIDVTRDALADSQWKIEDSALVQFAKGEGRNRIQFPVKPPAEYELRVTAVSLAPGTSVFVIGLVVGSSQAGFVVNQATKITGLEAISGKSFDDPTNETMRSDLLDRPPDQPLHIVCRVTPSSVQAFVNGKRAVDWKGDSATLRGNGNRGAPDKSKLFLCADAGRVQSGSYRFTAIDLLPLGGRPQSIPPTDAVAATSEKVKQLIGDLPATAAAAQRQFAADQLHRQAATTDDDALRYALLTEAVRQAAAADDVHLANYFLEDLGRCFEVDPSVLLTNTLNEIAGRTRPVKERSELIVKLSAMAQEHATAEQFALAVPLAKAASAAAAKTTDNDAKKEYRYREQEVEEYAKLHVAAEPARETLATMPDDGAANLAVGTYLAVVRSDWTAALPHLTKAGDPTVRAAAQLESQSGSDLAKAADVAAAWIEAADKAPLSSKAVYFDHARHRFADGAASTKSVATAKMLPRYKKVEADVLRTAGSAFVKRHPLGATAHGGHWYEYFPENTPWDEARQRCRELGGHLVCIETAAENQWVFQFATAKFGKPDSFNLWTGGTEVGHDNIFTWVNGSPFQYNDWAIGEPDSTISESILLTRDGSGGASWFDGASNSRYPFICEWDR